MIQAAQAEAVQTQATEAAQPEAAETESAEQIVGDLFPGMFDEAEEQPTKKTPEKAEAKEEQEDPEKEEQEESVADPFEAIDNDELFSERSLSSKQGVIKARELIVNARKAARELKHDANRKHIVASKREKAAKETQAETNRIYKNVEAINARINADLDIIHTGHAGNRQEVLDALGRIGRRSGVDMYELLTEAVLGIKKDAKNKPDAAAQKRIDELEAKLKAREKREEEEQQEREAQQIIERSVAVLDKEYRANTADYPSIQALLGDKEKAPQLNEWIVELLRERQWPDASTLLTFVESHVRKLIPAARKAEPAQQARKSGRAPGRGVSPSLGAGKGPTRKIDELDQEERDRLLEEDMPNILADMGLEL